MYSEPPGAALAPFVRRFLVLDFRGMHRDAHLPDTGLVIVLPFRDRCRVHDNLVVDRPSVTGLHDRIRRHEHAAGSAVLLAQLTPRGGSALLPHALDQFANTSTPLELVLNENRIRRLENEVGAAANHTRRIGLLRTFLIEQLQRAEQDPLVEAAIAWLQNAPLGARVQALVRHIGLSQSALERRFLRRVGCTPRRFLSIVRIQRVLALHRSGLRLTDLAHEAGYFDQPHFIRDLQQCTGQSPRAFFASAEAH